MLSNATLQTLNFIIDVLFTISSLFGTIGNVLTALTCFQRRLRNTPTYIFMIFIAIINIFPLISQILILIMSQTFKLDNDSIFFKINTFFSFWASHNTSYLIVSVIFL